MSSRSDRPSPLMRRKDELLGQVLVLCLLIGGAIWGGGWLFENFQDRNKPRLEILSSDGSVVAKFVVEVMLTNEERMRGLMYRKPEDFKQRHGMFFVFPSQEMRSFWMRNTYIPLDMLFFDESCKLVSIIENVPILNELPRKGESPAQYVLEINAGLSAKLGIKKGHQCRLSGGIPTAVQ